MNRDPKEGRNHANMKEEDTVGELALGLGRLDWSDYLN
jgi:hypothetical protein